MTDTVPVIKQPTCPVCGRPSHCGTPEWPLNLASAPAPPDRYCEICGDAASYADLNRSTGRTIHRNMVCSLWTPQVRVNQLVLGSIISSYRLMNYYSPVRVAALGLVGADNKVPIGLQDGRWVPNPAGSLQLLFEDSPVITHYLAYNDLTARAETAIAAGPFTAEQVPPHWLETHHGWRSGSLV